MSDDQQVTALPGADHRGASPFQLVALVGQHECIAEGGVNRNRSNLHEPCRFQAATPGGADNPCYRNMVGAEQRTDCGSLRLPSLTEIALSGAILKPVTRWITNARRISMAH